MGLSDCECAVCVFGNCWPGHWASAFRDIFVVENLRFNMIYYQVFPPVNAIFAGIGVLLLVRILMCRLR